jgi:hypothetical protein
MVNLPELQAREVIVPEMAHNPTCMDASPAGGPKCVLLHIGTGDRPAQQQMCGCSHGRSEPGYPFGVPCSNQSSISSAVFASKSSGIASFVAQTTNFNGTWENVSIACGTDKSGVQVR